MEVDFIYHWYTYFLTPELKNIWLTIDVQIGQLGGIKAKLFSMWRQTFKSVGSMLLCNSVYYFVPA